MSLKNEVEALLFASGRHMTAENLAELVGESKTNVSKALKDLQKEYEDSESALQIMNAANGWKMGVKESYLPLVQKIVADTELPTPVLETLAVVAWKRPILQSEVIDMRGDHAYSHIHLLRDLGFLTREKHGRTYKLKLAEKFFEYFDVEGDAEIRELFSEVKRPEPEVKPKKEEKLGELEVVDLKKEREEEMKQGKLGQLEIVEDVDPYEKRKVTQEELDELEEELKKISKRTDESVKELEKYKPEPEEDEDDSEGVVDEEDEPQS